MSKPTKCRVGDSRDDLELDTLNQNHAGKTEEMVTGRLASSRHKLLHTGCLCSTMFILGWTVSCMGPTFPDVRMLINEDLATASWIFTGLSLGTLIGAPCGGFAYDKLPKIGLFVCVTVGLSATVSLLPWCPNLPSMIAVHVFTGALICVLDVSVTTDIIAIWGSKADSYMQLVHSMFCIGAIVSPVVANPFLAQKNRADHNVFENTTSASDGIPPNKSATNLVNTTSSSSEPVSSYGETSIFVVYSIVAGLCILSCIFYVVVAVAQESIYSKRNKKFINKKHYFLSTKMKATFTVLIALNLALYLAAERGIAMYLMTFLLSELGWTKAWGSSATSIFWMAIAGGRLISMFVVRFTTLHLILVMSNLIMIAGGVVLLISVALGSSPLVWLAVVVIGLGFSPIFAASLTWLAEYVITLTGKMTSVFFVSNAIGSMTFPLLLGYLMENFSSTWFVYFEMIVFVAMNILIITVIIWYKVLSKTIRAQNVKEVKIQASDCQGSDDSISCDVCTNET